MRNRVTKLLVVLMLAIAVPAGAWTYWNDTQWCYTQSNTYWGCLAYNFYGGYNYMEYGYGSNWITCPMGYNSFWGYNMYDYSSGGWTCWLNLHNFSQ